MIDAADLENSVSSSDEDERYDPLRFDPEQTFVDDEIDSDTIAFHDATRDLWSSGGHFQILSLP
jgi:hypothetical protein